MYIRLKANKSIDSIKEKMAQILEMPKEIVLDLPKIIIIGDSELSIENYKGILEYESDVIRVKTIEKIVKVEGKNLEITVITDEEVQITGTISDIKFV